MFYLYRYGSYECLVPCLIYIDMVVYHKNTFM